MTQAVEQWQQDGTWDHLVAAFRQGGLIPRVAGGAALLAHRVMTQA